MIRFSILVAVFNRPDLVRQTIDSVLAQTFSNYELIVVDDGSTDETVAVLKSYGPMLKLLQQPNSGAEAARSNGASIATGEYLVGLDSDDLLYPDALATYDKLIRDLGSPPLILGAMSQFQNGEPVPPNLPTKRISYLRFHDFLSKDRSIMLSYSQLIIKRSVAESMGALRPKATAFPFDIADVMLLTGTCTPFILVIEPYTIAYRLHAGNTVKRIDYLLQNIGCLASFERKRQYPGGSSRKFDRYAYIGTISGSYFLMGMKNRRFHLAARVLAKTAPMMLAGIIGLLKRRLRPRIKLEFLEA